MQLLLSVLALLTVSLTTAVPTTKSLTNFLLVTTTQNTHQSNSSALAHVSATSLFDPLHQAEYLLRLIEPGYGSLPTFNLTHGRLQSLAYGPEGVGLYDYDSENVVGGEQLLFTHSALKGAGNVGLKNGYLVTVGGQAKGWTICDGPEGERVIYWKGNATNCAATYLQAVSKAPY